MKKIQEYAAYAAWVVALTATLGSLYFQYGLHLPPCVLCWYQRIAMYPLVLIIPVNIVRKDKGLFWYVMPLTIVGACIALYHNLLYYGILPESIAPCAQGVSCTTKLIEWFGFVTIPLLSLAAFISIAVCMLIISQRSSNDKRN